MNKPRRHFLGTEKVAILKRHLIDKVPVSDLCDELDIYPNQLYGWLKEFFENGHVAFDKATVSSSLCRGVVGRSGSGMLRRWQRSKAAS